MRRLERLRHSDGTYLSVSTAFSFAIDGLQDHEIRSIVQVEYPNIERAEEEYRNCSSTRSWFRMPTSIAFQNRAYTELISLYSNGIVRRKEGRVLYNAVMSNTLQGRCPYCGIGVASTIDHYLPKSRYPYLSITPDNLVPACKDCQDNKGAYLPLNYDGQLLHPYYDDKTNVVWLKAEVVCQRPAAFKYSVDNSSLQLGEDRRRICNHFDMFKLAVLFSVNAADELASNDFRFRRAFERGGVNSLKEQISDAYESARQVNLASWRAAMYRAALESDWFCNEYFSVSNP